MKKYRQLVTSNVYGDCFRACMATILQLPPEVLPNDFSPMWHWNWERYLDQFGLALSPDVTSKGPIWLDEFWIASVPSLNYENGTHAIVMHNTTRVFHDPSNKKRYKTGTSLDSNIVLSGKHLIVADVTKFHRLDEYRNKLINKEK